MNKNENHLAALSTNAVDLFAPSNRFVSASKIYARLHRALLLLGKYWWLVTLIVLAVFIPIFLYTLFTGPTYKSTASMWVTGKITMSDQSGYTEQLVDYLGTQAALLSSPEIQRLAYTQMLTAVGGGGPGIGNFATNRPGPLSVPAPGGGANSPVPFSVDVEQGSKSSTLGLTVVGRDPAATRQFLVCLMQEYLTFKRAASDKASEDAARSLTEQTAQLKRELAEAGTQLQNFQASNDVVFLEQQGSSSASYLGSLNHQLAVLRTELKLLGSIKPEQWLQTYNVQQESTDQLPADNMSGAREMLAGLQQSQTAMVQADQQKRLLMSQRTKLAEFLRPAHPKIIKLNQDIAEQQDIIQASQDEAAKQLALRRQALKLQIQNLEAASTEWTAKTIDASRKMAAYQQIQQRVQRLQNAYDKTFSLIQQVDVDKSVGQADVGILDPASTAKPTQRMLVHMGIAAVLAFLLCFAALYSIALFQDNFASPMELEEHLSAPVLGQIPSISMKASRSSLGVDELEQQRFEFLEAFRNIRASLLFMSNGGASPKTMIITSSIPEEGKSTVALYLAATLAKSDSRVLLVDADMHRPSLHKYFGLPKGPGLAELLDNETTMANVIPSGVKNLALLRAGQAKRNPGDLVLSSVWAEFLRAARTQFDYILVDTPPVAATDDAAALAPKTDGILFVVRALSTSARVASSALAVVRQRQAHVVGLIFNRAVSSACERPYYEAYARGYHWQKEEAVVGSALPATEYYAEDPQPE